MKNYTQVQGVVSDGIGYDKTLVDENQEAFETAIGYSLYPGSLNVMVDKPIKYSNYKIVQCDGNSRIYIEGFLNDYPIIISHKYPIKPRLKKKVLVFADVGLRKHLKLENNQKVFLKIKNYNKSEITKSDSLEYCFFYIRSKLLKVIPKRLKNVMKKV